MKRFLLNCLISGAAAGVLSHFAAAIGTRARRSRSDLAMHAVSHIAWDDHPRAHKGRHAYNWALGAAMHHGACIFWATFFEALFGRRAERSSAAAIVGGATLAGAAYVTDYHLVASRFRPGFEVHLSNRALFFVYAALALGLAVGARSRGLGRHQIEDDHEREERRNPKRRPRAVVAPE